MTVSARQAAKNNLFNPSIDRAGKKSTGTNLAQMRPDEARAVLDRDVNAWLAKGNRITTAPPAIDRRDSRRVRVSETGYL